jgi:predicted ribosome quality control (RQC) complex YloA/Tae2 family protein
MSPGFEYNPPPPAPGIPPESTPTESEWRDVVTKATQLAADAQAERNKGGKGGTKRTPGVEKGMVRAFRGVSPALASTLLSGAGPETSTLGPDPPASALDDDAWRALHAEWRRWVDAATRAVNAVGSDDDDDVAPVLDRSGWCENRGQLLLHEPNDPSAAGHAPLSAASRAADPAGAGGPIGALFARVYGGAGDADVFRREKDRLLQAIGAAVKKNGQKVRSFRKQIADAAAHEDVKVRADEIMAYQHGYQQGADTLVVYDFETGEARDVPIDPLKGGPVAAAEALYKKARKQRRTATAVEPLLEAASREAEYLEQVEFSIRELTGTDGEDDVAALEQINAELVDARLVKPTGKGAAAEIKRQERGSGKGGKKKAAPQKAKKKGRDDPMLNIRKYAAPSGKEVLVGRNSRGNEAVSLSIGKDQDVWFHVRGAPGAHVILRQQPGQEASDEDLQYAADLAAFHSKLRTGGKVDVSFTSPKFVRKPSGGRLGMVTIDKEKVMLGMPDASEAAEEEAKDRAAGKKTASSW